MPNIVSEDADAHWVGINGKLTRYKPGDTITAGHETVMKSSFVTPAVGTTPTGQIIIYAKDQKSGSYSKAAGVTVTINRVATYIPLEAPTTVSAGVKTALDQAGIVYRIVTS